MSYSSTGGLEVVVSGGVGVSNTFTRHLLSSVEVFSLASGRWRYGPELPRPQLGAGQVGVGGTLLVGGRWRVEGRLKQGGEVLQLQEEEWRTSGLRLKSPRDMGVTVPAPAYC